jgi:hypothetical protein
MNNKGQVVFSYMAGEPNGTQVEHAWLWLPETD